MFNTNSIALNSIVRAHRRYRSMTIKKLSLSSLHAFYDDYFVIGKSKGDVLGCLANSKNCIKPSVNKTLYIDTKVLATSKCIVK